MKKAKEITDKYNLGEDAELDILRYLEYHKKKWEKELESRPNETIVILRKTLEKELETFKEVEKGVETPQGHAHYEGIYIGLRSAINHIIQLENPTK